MPQQRSQPAPNEEASTWSWPGDGLFWFLALASFALRSLVAIKGHSIRHPDEVFQTIEQSHLMVFGFGVVPWEYVEGIRWIGTPLLLTPPLWLARWLGWGPEIYVPLTGILLAALSLIPIVLFYRLLRSRDGTVTAALACLLPLFWYENLDFASSTLSDAMGATLLGSAAVLLHWLGKGTSGRVTVAFAVLLALTFAVRFHLAPALAVLGVVALVQLSHAGRVRWLLGLLVSAAALALLDLVFGMYPFQHVWLNAYRNIVDGVAESYGVEPVSYYAAQIWEHTGPAGVLILGVLLASIRVHWRLSVPAFLLLIAFSFVAHKEYRFYYPATLLLTFAAGWGLTGISRLIGQSYRQVRVVLACVVIMMAVSPFYAKLIQERTDNAFAAAHAASLDEAICGLAVSGLGFWWTGGNTHFHRNVPLEAVSLEQLTLGDQSQRYNAVMSVPGQAQGLAAIYPEQRCWDETSSQAICLYVRDGGCS